MNVAQWIDSPAFEKEQAKLRRQFATLDGAYAILQGIAIASVLAFIVLPFLIPVALPIAFAGGMAAVRIAHRRQVLRDCLAAPDLAMHHEFGFFNGWLVEMTVLQGSAPTGRDRGVLWFEAGRLFFSGHRTSFSLGTADVFGRLRGVRAIPDLHGTLLLPLASDTPVAPLTLSLLPAPEKRDKVAHAIADWRRDAPAERGQLPPLGLGPNTPTRKGLLVRAVGTLAYWILTGGGTLWIALQYDFVFGSFLLVLLVLGGYLVRLTDLVTPWRAWRDLGKVER